MCNEVNQAFHKSCSPFREGRCHMTAVNCLLGEDAIPEPDAQVVSSCLYIGKVTHVRSRPVHNAFSYSLFMVYLDLAELPLLFANSWFWSAEKPAWAWFRRADHLGNPEQPLDQAVRDLVAERLGARPEGPIRLLTNLRYWGCNMNPVSFYYCYDSRGRPAAFVAEVNNTPWGEQHCYVLPWDATRPRDAAQTWRHSKDFHVSPFLPMEMEYAWSVTEPRDSLTVTIANFDAQGSPFQASLSLKRREPTPANLSRTLLRYPCMTAKIVATIYWQALKLWWKGAVYYPHP